MIRHMYPFTAALTKSVFMSRHFGNLLHHNRVTMVPFIREREVT